MTEPTQHAESVAARVLRASAKNLPLDDASVDLVVTSPPFFGQRSYQDGDEHIDQQIGAESTPAEFLESLWIATAEMVRVLKPTGSIFVNLGDKYAHDNRGSGLDSKRGNAKSYPADPIHAKPRGFKSKSLMGLPWRYAIGCIDNLGLILRAEIIWLKPNGLPESVSDRVRRSHEQWFHFTTQERYFSDIDQIREPHTWLRKVDPKWAVAREATAERRGAGHRNGKSGGFTNPANPLGKHPGSVWNVAAEPLRIPTEIKEARNLPDHFAPFPPTWPVRIIAGWSPPGGVVLDPFGGTGTTAMVAMAMGREAITVDLSADYCRLAEWRIHESGGGEKAVAKVRGKGLLRQPVSQESLDLGGAA